MLELKGISAGYSKKTVLQNIDLSFEKGKLTSIIGINGCGKSTLLKSAVGILPIHSGSIIIDGSDFSSLTRKERAKRIAYLPQNKNIPDMTVLQMVLHGRFPFRGHFSEYSKKDREAALAALSTLKIAHLADIPLYKLSGGMLQSVYISMAIAQDTDYILLDEPTVYLDISHRLDLMKCLSSLAEGGKGVISVTHDLLLAFDFSDRIAVLDSAGLTAYGTPAEIRENTETEKIFGVKIKFSESEKKHVYAY